jgi:hypothetical protein
MAAGVLLALAAAFLCTPSPRWLGDSRAYAPADCRQLALSGLVLAPMASIDPYPAAQWTCLVVVVGLVHTGLVYNLMYGAFSICAPEAITEACRSFTAGTLLARLIRCSIPGWVCGNGRSGHDFLLSLAEARPGCFVQNTPRSIREPR